MLDQTEKSLQFVREIEIPCQLNLAHCYLKAEVYDYAIDYATKVLVSDVDNCKALYRRGIAYTKKGQTDKAKADLTRALELVNLNESEALKEADKGETADSTGETSTPLAAVDKSTAASFAAEKNAILRAIADMKKCVERNKTREREMSARMIISKETKPSTQ